MRCFRTVALAATILAPSGSAAAQTLLLGATAGVNHTNVTYLFRGTPEDAYNDRAGFTGGLTLAVQFSDVFSLQTEALYTQKGAAQQPYFAIRLAYLELPVLLRARLPLRLIGTRPVLLAGVVPAREISCSGFTTPYQLALDVSRPPSTVPLDCATERTQLRDLGILAALGLEKSVGTARISTELRYTYGTMNLIPTSAYVRKYNRATAVRVGVAVPILGR